MSPITSQITIRAMRTQSRNAGSLTGSQDISRWSRKKRVRRRGSP